MGKKSVNPITGKKIRQSRKLIAHLSPGNNQCQPKRFNHPSSPFPAGPLQPDKLVPVSVKPFGKTQPENKNRSTLQ
jgi:hypothetical protein